MTGEARRRWLEGAAPDGSTATTLGLADSSDDAAIAEALAVRVVEVPLTLAAAGALAPADDEPAARGVLGRIGDIDDARTLELIARGGPMRARRSALRRMMTLLDEEKLEPEAVAQLDALFSTARDLDVAGALTAARLKLPGAAGREARAESDTVATLSSALSVAVRRYWEGEAGAEPLAALEPESRALIATRLAQASDLVVAHVCCLLDASAPGADVASRLELLGLLRHAADPRLISTLSALLASPRSEIMLEAARALSRIEDPRVRPLLFRALSSAAAPHERAVLAGALGRTGDHRGGVWARRLLTASDTAARRAALEAMAVLATSADLEALAPHVLDSDLSIVRLCVAALGRTGDAAALPVLARARGRGLSALDADIDDAESAVRSQLELSGEAVPALDLSGGLSTQKRAALRATGPGLVSRTLGTIDWALGGLWAWIGARARAMRHFQRAATRCPGWAAPLVALAETLFSTGDTASALAASRRAIEADQRWVEGHGRAVGLVSRVFLRRAEETSRGGLRDIARGLLEEVLALDLRRAPSALRFELERRLSSLGSEVAREAPT